MSTERRIEITRREALATLAAASAAAWTGCAGAQAQRPGASSPSIHGDKNIAAKYIDAFFVNVNWDAVNARLERAQNARTALRGVLA